MYTKVFHIIIIILLCLNWTINAKSLKKMLVITNYVLGCHFGWMATHSIAFVRPDTFRHLVILPIWLSNIGRRGKISMWSFSAIGQI